MDGGANGEGLWTTDGTDAGTHFVKTVNPATGTAPNLYPPGNAAEAHGKLLFIDATGALWQSDGTDGGTAQALGPDTAHDLVHVGSNDVFFRGRAAPSGSELWRAR